MRNSGGIYYGGDIPDITTDNVSDEPRYSSLYTGESETVIERLLEVITRS